MATTLTSNLRLRLTDELSADARYNLNRIDQLGSRFVVGQDSDVYVRSLLDIHLEPNSPSVSGSGLNGAIIFGDEGRSAADDIDVYVYARSFQLTAPIGLLDQGVGGTRYLRLQYNSDHTGATDTDADRILTVDMQGGDRDLVLGGDIVTSGSVTVTNISDLNFTAIAPGASLNFLTDGTHSLYLAGDLQVQPGAMVLDPNGATRTISIAGDILTAGPIVSGINSLSFNGPGSDLTINSDGIRSVNFEGDFSVGAGSLTFAPAGSHTVAVEASGTMVLEAATQTLTNKTIDSDVNTITNIVNADIKAAAAIAVDKLAALDPTGVVVTDGSGFLSVSATVSATELGYLDGVTSNIQDQLDLKVEADPVVGPAGSVLRSNGVTNDWDFPVGTGDVVGITPSTDNAVARFDAVSGKAIQSSLVSLDDLGEMSGATIDGDSNTLIDKRWVTANVAVVKRSNAGTGEFSTVEAALTYVATQLPSISNPWVVDVGPGVYQENALTIPSGVQIKGEGTAAVILEALSTTGTFITGAAAASISRLTVRGASGIGGVGIAFSNGASFDRFDIDNCVLRDCETLATVTGSSSTTVATFRNCTLRGTFTTGISVSASGGALTQVLVNGMTYNQPGGPAATDVLRCTGVATLYVSDSIFTQPGGRAIRIDDGTRLFVTGSGFAFNAAAITVDNVGAAPQVNINGMLVRQNTVDVNIAHTTCTGAINGSFSPTNSTIASDLVSVFATDPNDGITFTGDITFGPTFGERTAYTQLFTKAPTMGVLSGGELTDGGGLTINVAAGDGYYSTGTPIAYHSWNATFLNLADNEDIYIYFDNTGTLTSAATLPVLSDSILLGRAVTDDGTIKIIDQANMQAHHTVNANTEFFRNALGPVFQSGCITTENVTGLHLDVTSGIYYLGPKKFTPAAGTNITWYRVYDGEIQATANAVDTANYNLNGTGGLIPMTGTSWTKHSLYVSGDGVDQKYLMIQGQQQYGSRAAAIAAPIPSVPAWMRDSICPIAAIVTQRNDVDIMITQNGEILDIRPRIGFSAASALVSTDHSTLSNLQVDTHLIYLPVDGSRPMEGALDMDGFSIVTADSAVGATDQLTITTGAATVSDTSGTLDLRTGDAAADSSGSITIQTGNGDPTSGAITLQTGNSGMATGGVTITSGESDATGEVVIYSGDANVSSGEVLITSGNSSGSTSGNLSLRTGEAPSGDSGNLYLQTGAASGVQGQIVTLSIVSNMDEVRFYDDSQAFYVGINAAETMGTDYSLTLPDAQGAAGTVLTNDGAGGLSWGAGASLAIVNVSSNVTLTNSAIHLVSTAASRNLTLPAPSADLYIVVKDSTGAGAATNSINIVVPGAETLDGSSSYLLNKDRQSATIVSDGTNYFII